MMAFLARGVVVPPEDEQAKKVVVFPNKVKENILSQVLLKIYSQKAPPTDPFIAVKYRNNWFYIDRTDITSKRAFGTLMFLYQLQAPASGTHPPLLTLPAG